MRPSLRFAIAAALMALCARVPASMAGGRDRPNVVALLRNLDDLYRSKSSIAKRIIDPHDSQIVVDCPPTGGTAVVVRLPIGNA